MDSHPHREFVGGDGRTWSDETGSWEVKGGKLEPPEEDGVWLDATAWELLCQYNTARRSMALHDRLRKEAKDALVKIMGAARYGHYAGQRVVNVIRSRPRRFKEAQFAEDHPGLYDSYREPPEDDQISLFIPPKVEMPKPAPTGDTA